MKRLSEFRDFHKGQTCAILGGGVSLPTDLRSIPQVDVLIGVNQHAVILPLDYLVFSDREMWPYIEGIEGCYKVSNLNKWPDRSDYIHCGEAPAIGFSGAKAVWVADFMGFERVYICGMDQYADQRGREYWWQGPQSEPFIPKHAHCRDELTRWKEFLLTLQHPERVYFVSGRLREAHQ